MKSGWAMTDSISWQEQRNLQDRVSVGVIIETEDFRKEIVIIGDGQKFHMIEVIDQ